MKEEDKFEKLCAKHDRGEISDNEMRCAISKEIKHLMKEREELKKEAEKFEKEKAEYEQQQKKRPVRR